LAQTIVIVPGLNGSGPTHWQTHWQVLLPNAVRVVQSDWTRPRRGPWVDALTDTIDAHPGSILGAHSLGCADSGLGHWPEGLAILKRLTG
jgi:hypothetical protein